MATRKSSASGKSKFNLLDELEKIVENSLINPTNAERTKLVALIQSFGLRSGASIAEIKENLSAGTKSTTNKFKEHNTVESLAKTVRTVDSSNTNAVIASELEALKAGLLGSETYLDSFNTEYQLLEIISRACGLKELSPKQTGYALLLLYIYGFERIEIPECEIFWRLEVKHTYTYSSLKKLAKIAVEIIEENLEPIDLDTLNYRIGKKLRGNDYLNLNPALVQFMLRVNRRVEALESGKFYQIYFHELPPSQYSYRILNERGSEMKPIEIADEVIERLQKVGKSTTPATVKNQLSTNKDLYDEGNQGGWVLTKWDKSKLDAITILETWFRNTKVPATLDEMINHVKTIRTDLEYLTIQKYIKDSSNITGVEMESPSIPHFFHRSVPLSDEFRLIRATRGSRISRKKSIAKRPLLFVSYAHENEDRLGEFQRHFDYRKDIEIFIDTKIPSGAPWDKEIKTKLEKADEILFLVSPEFLASDYIKRVEIKRALKRAAKTTFRIFWVLVEDCDLTDHPLADLQAAHKIEGSIAGIKSVEDRSEAILEIVKTIKRELVSSNS